MKIDCHTHLGRNQHINFSVKQLLESMDDAGIDKSLVFAGEINDCPNEWMLEQISPHKDRLFGVAAANPTVYEESERFKEIVRISNWFMNEKIVACKFYTGYEHFYPQSDIISKYLNVFQEIGCPVIFHSGDCLCSINRAKLKYAHPLHIDEIAVDYPNLKIVIAHMGFPWVIDAAEVCYKNKNVYADISGFVYGKFTKDSRVKFKKVMEQFLDICPKDKLLFGSDAPISDQESYVDVAEDVLKFDVDRMAEVACSVFNLGLK